MHFHWVFLGEKRVPLLQPTTREIKVSKDVVFDELRSWYGEQKLIQVEGGNKDDMQEKMCSKNHRL